MEESINATDLRVKTRDIIERARFRGARFVIHAFGKPVAVIMGIDEYRALVSSESEKRKLIEIDGIVQPQPSAAKPG